MSNSFVTPLTVAHQAPLSMGFPRQEIPEWVAIYSRGSSQPRDQTQVSCISLIFTIVPPPEHLQIEAHFILMLLLFPFYIHYLILIFKYMYKGVILSMNLKRRILKILIKRGWSYLTVWRTTLKPLRAGTSAALCHCFLPCAWQEPGI